MSSSMRTIRELRERLAEAESELASLQDDKKRQWDRFQRSPGSRIAAFKNWRDACAVIDVTIACANERRRTLKWVLNEAAGK